VDGTSILRMWRWGQVLTFNFWRDSKVGKTVGKRPELIVKT